MGTRSSYPGDRTRAHLAPVAGHLGSARQFAYACVSSARVYRRHLPPLSLLSCAFLVSEPFFLARIRHPSLHLMIHSRPRVVQVIPLGVADAVAVAADLLDNVRLRRGEWTNSNDSPSSSSEESSESEPPKMSRSRSSCC